MSPSSTTPRGARASRHSRPRPCVRRAANRLQERSTADRVYGRLKDEFGGHRIHVVGHVKVMAQRMCGIWVLDQVIRLPH